MSKLEWIFRIFVPQISQELSLFWRDRQIKPSKLEVDPDNRQGIIIYAVSRLRNPQIITEVNLTNRYLPKGVKKSSRAYYLGMVGAACTYLIELEKATQMFPEPEKTKNILSNKKEVTKDSQVEDCYKKDF